MNEFSVRHATPEDEQEISRLVKAAVAWLATRNTDQWQNTALLKGDPERTRAKSVDRGEIYVVVDNDGRIVGSFALDSYADPDFWSSTDHPDDALYLHRMVRDRSINNHSIGDVILDYASRQAAQQGKHWLRLDAWRTNTGLHDYYKRHGFEHVRSIDLPDRGSGALFQRSVI